MIHPKTCWPLAGWKCALHHIEVELPPDDDPFCRLCEGYPRQVPSLLRYWFQLLTFRRRIHGHRTCPWTLTDGVERYFCERRGLHLFHADPDNPEVEPWTPWTDGTWRAEKNLGGVRWD